ncbi:hypothetical protein H9657_17500 [Cellulomonas sp. Sa3CUA2]|uniref:Secreted protein n=1 Tax=Cellulomonas avistercoris TaxID=2762242 RepID=A0ABR8QI27_9CELL|nr:hypothetical protein [Cellulomonas avistercoris]MBD7920070.1 hypothetical protein [Cellulomonas avistercoris]
MMFTFLRRAVATVLVAAGLVLTSTGVVTGVDDHVVPGALVLVLGGVAVLLYRHLDRPRPVVPVVRAVPSAVRVAPSVPAQRSAPHCAGPAPRVTSAGASPLTAPALGTVGRWNASATRAAGPVRGGVRHCVMPRGGLPHQRHASDGS